MSSKKKPVEIKAAHLVTQRDGDPVFELQIIGKHGGRYTFDLIALDEDDLACAINTLNARLARQLEMKVQHLRWLARHATRHNGDLEQAVR